MSTDTVKSKAVPELWASAARIIACLGVFWGHFMGMYDVNISPWDFNSFRVFMFLAGYFAFIKGMPGFAPLTGWLIRKLKSLFVPYWLVIIPVIVVNWATDYKPQTLFRNSVVIFGGSMFLDNPLYIVAWFITFITLLWLFIYLYQMPRQWGGRFLVFLGGLAFFAILSEINNNGIDEPYEFLIFFAGYALRGFREMVSAEPRVPRYLRLSRLLFAVQNYTYSYILIHGAVVILTVKVLELPFGIALVASLAGTAVLSFVHHHVSLWLQKRIPFPLEKRFPYRRPAGAVQGRIA